MAEIGKYDHAPIERKWREWWAKEKIYQPSLKSAAKPFYNLMMFPYPSAEGLHVGNVYAFTGADIYGRYMRMKGFNVFEPIGLDGFGIHSENYAIKIGKHPKEQAKVSEARFYEQLSNIGNGFAWDNRLETYHPEYYKWTQWLFIQMFKRSLAYRKTARVNWCPSCKTVLADEQVVGGICERCKSQTTFKELPQWFFKITAYADRLLEEIEGLKWPKKIKTAQRQWIGRKAGINIHYPIVNEQGTRINEGRQELEVVCFTTRPDTNFGATFVVIGPEHQLVGEIAAKVSPRERKEIEKYVVQAMAKTENERITEGRAKTGVFTGCYALNRLNDYRIPIYISDFVLGQVGTGAVVGVPGHDLRDFQFAQEKKLPVIRVVVGSDGDKSAITKESQVQEKEGQMINSDFLNGLEINEAIEKMMVHHEAKGWGERVFNYHLRDWLISRQRYWGAPIPMVECPKCGWQAVPEVELPIRLPDLVDWQPKGDGRGPLDNAPEEWLYTKCPVCGGKAKRETDVCDTFLDSSWYFLAYPNLQTPEWHGQEQPFNLEIMKKWLPVDAYIGGAEHAVLHLLYSRFVWKFLSDQELLPFKDKPEPFPFLYGHGLIIKEGAKMSKSRGNVVIPDEYMSRYGVDALRLYLMFLGPYDQGGDFKDTGIRGMKRFLDRLWQLLAAEPEETETNEALNSKLMETIIKVDQDLAHFRFNTAIAALMELVNVWKASGKMGRSEKLGVVKLLAPLAPFMAEEWYQRLAGSGRVESVHRQSFPQADEQIIKAKDLVVVVQVNGKLRATLALPPQSQWDESSLSARAKEEVKVRRWLEGKTIQRTVVIQPTPKRQGLVNFVVD